jgi:hypothetical protein
MLLQPVRRLFVTYQQHHHLHISSSRPQQLITLVADCMTQRRQLEVLAAADVPGADGQQQQLSGLRLDAALPLLFPGRWSTTTGQSCWGRDALLPAAQTTTAAPERPRTDTRSRQPCCCYCGHPYKNTSRQGHCATQGGAGERQRQHDALRPARRRPR